MGIHSLLVLRLCRDEKGEIPLVKVVGTSNIEVRFGESYLLPVTDQPDFTAPLPPRGITPDIVVTRLGESDTIAIEVKGDIRFDPEKTLEQIKKYSKIFEVRLIIPKEQEKYGPYFRNEGFRVYLWKATRVWQCESCLESTHEKTRIKPRCSNQRCKSPHKLSLLDLIEIEIEDHDKPLEKPFKYHGKPDPPSPRLF